MMYWGMALHGVCGAFGGIAAGIFTGQQALGGLGGVSIISQIIGTGLGIIIALIGGFGVYGILKATLGIRLSQEDEYRGADLSPFIKFRQTLKNPCSDVM